MADKFMLRLPEGMRDRLKEVAKENRRSMNAQIVTLLERQLFDPLEMKKGSEVSA